MTTDLENEAYNLATVNVLTTNLSKDGYEAQANYLDIIANEINKFYSK